MSDEDAGLFSTMAEALRRIALYVAGFDLRTFIDDQRTIDAVALNFLVVGECARRLSVEARLNPAGPWQKMAALRHRIAHGYASVEPGVLWGIATRDAPALRTKINAMFGET